MSAIHDRKKLEQRITDIVADLVDRMDLGWLEVQVLFDEKGDPDCVAKSHCNWEYRRIVMTWTLGQAAALKFEELSLVAIHELCHALIEPIWDSHPNKDDEAVTKLGELSTENVARVVKAVLDA